MKLEATQVSSPPVYFSLEHETSQRYIQQLLSSDPAKCLEAVEFIKNVAIGSNRQKEAIMSAGLVPRFLQILDQFNDTPDQHEELLFETTATINSLAKGTEEHSRCLIEAGTIRVLLTILMNNKAGPKYISIVLKALRSLFASPSAPHGIIYEWPDGPELLISRLLSLASPASTAVSVFSNQECVCNIFASSLGDGEATATRQKLLSSCGAVDTIAVLLSSPAYIVQIAALTWLSRMSHQNDEVSRIIVTTTPSLLRSSSRLGGSSSSGGGFRSVPGTSHVLVSSTANNANPCSTLQTVPDLLADMMSQEMTREMQLLAAKCMTYLYRSGVICPEDKRIVYKTLPTLIRCIKPPVSPLNKSCCRAIPTERETSLRAEAASVLSYLTELDTSLQQTAAYCDQVIPTIADLFKYQSSSTSLLSENESALPSYLSGQPLTPAAVRKLDQEVRLQNELKEAAFKAFASLAANDEDVRKKILEQESLNLMDHIVAGLSQSSHPGVRLAALKCLHSLSRSVQQARPAFSDHSLWTPLKNLLNCPTSSVEVLTLSSSALCNLLLEFSPSKQHLLDRTTLEILISLTQRSETSLRVNGVWALMNMVYKADQAVKIQILQALGMDAIFKLINDTDEGVVMKTLGLLRNLLSIKGHIDQIMTLHGKEIMDALILILDSTETSVDVKEQALCVLSNIADGESSKEVIMNNDEILQRLSSLLEQESTPALVRLQTAATFCITNLAWAEEEGALERQTRLKEVGIFRNLNNLVTTNDTDLFDKVKMALHQFP